MKKLIFLSICFLFALQQQPIQAQECSAGVTLINELWQNFDPLDLVNDKDGVKKQTNKLKNELKSFASLSLKKDAPRILPVGSGEKKINLKQYKKRIFVTTPLKQNNVIFTINRPESNSTATVSICSHTMKGATQNVERIVLDATNSGVVEIPIQGQKGKILSITVTNTGTQKIAYKIMAR